MNGSLTPNDVTSSSGKKAWWLGKCGHEWETRVADRNKGKDCIHCTHNPSVLKNFNDLWTTHPNVASLLLHPEDGYKYTYGSNKKVDWKCVCGCTIKSKAICHTVNKGLKCTICSDGFSFGEKVIYNLLKNLDVEFIREYSPIWANGKRYDFFIPKLDTIVEVHGAQHYYENKGMFGSDRTLEERIAIDSYKENIANHNGIKKYIVIDARLSEIDFLKNSISNSKLAEIFCLNNLDWNELFKNASNSLVLDVCNYYEQVDCSLKNISKEFNISITAIIRYLKTGNELGYCYYEPNGEIGKKSISDTFSKGVVQLTLKGKFIKEFPSIREASKELNISSSNISGVCRGNNLSANGYMWMFKDNYFARKDNIKQYRRDKSREIAMISLDGVFIEKFNSFTEASNHTSISQSGIKKCCDKEHSKAGNYVWMYYEDYLRWMENKTDLNVFKRERRIVQLDFDNKLINEWDSIKSASKHYSCNHSTIASSLYGKVKSSIGYKWMYYEDYEKCLSGEMEFPFKEKFEVVQLDMNNNLIEVYDNLNAIVDKYGIKKSNIVYACKNKRKHAGGYKWMYKKDYTNLLKENPC